MMLCIDVGNTHIYGGLFIDREIKLRFRCTSSVSTSDEIGIFLKSVIRENEYDPKAIKTIGVCSVVPQLDYSIRSACLKYFSIDPFFLQSGVKTGLNIRYRNPQDVGADRIANAIGALDLYPENNLIIIDFGTATTFCVVTKEKVYLGGAILPGVRLAVDALTANTAKLPAVEIIKINQALGRSTVDSIQSGVFYGAIGSCREILMRIRNEIFPNENVITLATGGFASLFDDQKIYDYQIPDLVLQGLRIAMENNT